MNIFVAYSRSDIQVVKRLIKALERRKRVQGLWFAPRDLRSKDDFEDAIIRQIKTCSSFLYCLGTVAKPSSPPSQMHLADELKIALRLRESKPDFNIYSVRLIQGSVLPKQIGDAVDVDLSDKGKWKYGVSRLEELLIK